MPPALPQVKPQHEENVVEKLATEEESHDDPDLEIFDDDTDYYDLEPEEEEIMEVSETQTSQQPAVTTQKVMTDAPEIAAEETSEVSETVSEEPEVTSEAAIETEESSEEPTVDVSGEEMIEEVPAVEVEETQPVSEESEVAPVEEVSEEPVMEIEETEEVAIDETASQAPSVVDESEVVSEEVSEEVITTTTETVTEVTSQEPVVTETTSVAPSSTEESEIVSEAPEETTAPKVEEVVTTEPSIIEMITEAITEMISIKPVEEVSSEEETIVQETTQAPTEAAVTEIVEEITTLPPVIPEVEEVSESIISTEQPPLPEVTEMVVEETTPLMTEKVDEVAITTTMPPTIAVETTTPEEVMITTEEVIAGVLPEIFQTTTQPAIEDLQPTTTTMPEVEPVVTTIAPVLPEVEEASSSCIQDDVEYLHSEDVPSKDPCQLCQCDNGSIVCATQDCPKPPENYKNCVPVPQEGECCPKYECDDETTARAEDNMEITTVREPKPLENIVPKIGGAEEDEEDQEKDQTVEEPTFDLNIIENEILDDDTEYVNSDDINLGTNCIEGGILYRANEEIPHKVDPCKACFCMAGTVICADRECPVPTGYEDCKPLPAPKDQCCPDQFECSKC